MGDAFGRALLDTLHGERTSPVEYRPPRDPGSGQPANAEDAEDTDNDDTDDTQDTEDAVVERYFATPETWPDHEHSLLDGLSGRVLDLGCGAGRHALYLQDQPGVTKVVAVDVSPRSVIATWERGVERSVVSNMACLPFAAGAFDHVVCLGTQICSGATLDDVRQNLEEAARVTDQGGSLLVDCFDPRDSDDWDWFGYEDGPEPGVGRRRFDIAYEGDRTRIELTLVSPGRFRDVATDAGWDVDVVDREGGIYSVRCERTT